MANIGSFRIETTRSFNQTSRREGVTTDNQWTSPSPTTGQVLLNLTSQASSKLFTRATGTLPSSAHVLQWYVEYVPDAEIKQCLVVLELDEVLTEEGFGSIICDHNRMIFNRSDAAFFQQKSSSTMWGWAFTQVTGFGAPAEVVDAFRKSSQYRAGTDTFVDHEALTFTIVDEKVSSVTPALAKSLEDTKPVIYPDTFNIDNYIIVTSADFTGDEAYRTQDLNEYQHIIEAYYGTVRRAYNTFEGRMDEIPTTIVSNLDEYSGSVWTRGTLEDSAGNTTDSTGFRQIFSISGKDPKFEHALQVVDTTLNTLIPGQAQGINFDLHTVLGLAMPLNSIDRDFIAENTANLGPSLVKATNCRAMFNIETPYEVTNTTFKVPGSIALGDLFNKGNPNFQPGSVGLRNKLINKKIRSYDGTFRATVTDTQYITSSTKALALDIDKDGVIDSLTDGLLVLRHAFGLTGESLINLSLSETALRNTANEIEAYIEALANEENFISTNGVTHSILDFDINGQIDALTDGVLMLRFFFELTGDALASGAKSFNSPLTNAEITAHMNTLKVFEVNIDGLNRFVSLDQSVVSDDSGEIATLITYTADADSIRSKPVTQTLGYSDSVQQGLNAEECHLYIEFEEEMEVAQQFDTVQAAITRFGDGRRSRTSSFIFGDHTNGEPRTLKTLTPPVILEPTEKGYFGATFATNINVNANNVAGREPSICHASGLSAGLSHKPHAPDPEIYKVNRSYTFDSDGFTSQDGNIRTDEITNVKVAANGDPILITIENPTGFKTANFGTTPPTLENCAITVVSDNLGAPEGTVKVLLTPGVSGKRFTARMHATYTLENNVVRYMIYDISGHVSSVETLEVINTPNDSWNYNPAVNVATTTLSQRNLIGNTSLQLSFHLPDVDDFASPAQLGSGYWSSTNLLTKVHVNTIRNCELENRVNPLKLTGSDNELFKGASYTSQYKGTYAVNDILLTAGRDKETTYRVEGYLEVSIPRLTSRNPQPRTQTYPFIISGSWNPEYGFEVLNDEGGTRLNLSSRPFRITSQDGGTLSRVNVDNSPIIGRDSVDQTTYSLSGGYYWKHIYTPTGTRDGFHPKKMKFNHVIETYWEGIKQNRVLYGISSSGRNVMNSVGHNQTFYNPSLPAGSQKDTELGPTFHKGTIVLADSDNTFDNEQAGTDYYSIRKLISLFQWEHIYASTQTGSTLVDLHTVPFSTFENSDTAKFIIVNNCPESRVTSVFHENNQQIIQRPDTWTIDPNTQEIFHGEFFTNTTEDYAKIIIRID